MLPELLCKALAGMAAQERITLEQFQYASGIASRSVAKSVLDFLSSNDIGHVSKSSNIIEFCGSDRLKTAMLAVQMGCDVEQVSKYLSWRDFEKLASEVLKSLGYRTQTNLRITKPRMEIDVLGVNNSGLAIAVDCKHWKRSSISSISNYSQKQAARVECLLLAMKRKSKNDNNKGGKSSITSIKQAVPVILTMHPEAVKFIDGIPIVPISQFRSFVMEINNFLSEVYVVR